MAAAEVGRETGDAGGPLLVAAIATASTLTGGLLALAGLLVATGAVIARPNEDEPSPPDTASP